ncbi:MAG: trypsin-like peptidase domain-containing protein [Patescibacteria group bacterium]|jgi:serine protease Do
MAEQKSSLTIVIFISLIVGALSGGVFGVLAGNGTLEDWVAVLPGFDVQESAQSVNTQAIALEEESATVDVVEAASPAVVSIIETQAIPEVFGGTSPFDSFFGVPQTPQSTEDGQRRETGRGTGFVISSDGLILTNRHVVSEESAEYTVIMNTGDEYTATVLARHPVYDLAIVQIEAEGELSYLELGESESIKIGQTVIAIGNALGQFRNTVTRGIISGLGRTITAGDGQGNYETLEDVIQTDAAINSGNSGGPLMNIAGQVIGVNTAVSSEGQLVGFAFPINQAKQAIESVQETGRIILPFLGVRYTVVDEQVQKLNDLPVDYGAVIVKGRTDDQLAIVPGSPADLAGLVENDIILEINGEKITNEHSLSSILAQYAPSDVVTIQYIHDGETLTKDIELAERAE